MRITIFICSFTLLYACGWCQAPAIEWQNNLGGTSVDRAWKVILSEENDLLIASLVYSLDIDVPLHQHDRAYWLCSLDPTGELQWDRVVGYVTGGNQKVELISRNNGSGYWAGATVDTLSDFSCTTSGISHIWLEHLNISGEGMGEICLGGSNGDAVRSLLMAGDGGVYLLGTSLSNDGDIPLNHGLSDLILLKLDSVGEVNWSRAYGGSHSEGGRSIVQTNDNDLLIAGTTRSNDHMLTGINPFPDLDMAAWLLKLDPFGELIWQQCYGGEDYDVIVAVGEYSNGDIWTVGYTRSTTNHADCNNYNADVCWVMRLDAQGEVLNKACFGSTLDSRINDAVLLPNDHLVCIGYTASAGGDVSEHYGATDVWIFQLDADLSLMWEKTYGGSDHDIANSAVLTPDGGLVFVGETSSNDGDLTGNHGMSDVWVVKLAPWDNGVVVQEVESKPEIHLFPNPAIEQLILQFSDPTTKGHLKIYNPLGELIHEQKVPQGQRRLEVELSKLTRGAYVIRLKQENTGESFRFIKL